MQKEIHQYQATVWNYNELQRGQHQNNFSAEGFQQALKIANFRNVGWLSMDAIKNNQMVQSLVSGLN
jgi:hypothetical protein